MVYHCKVISIFQVLARLQSNGKSAIYVSQSASWDQ